MSKIMIVLKSMHCSNRHYISFDWFVCIEVTLPMYANMSSTTVESFVTQAFFQKFKMSSSLNCLWKKDESPNSDSYIDYLVVKGHEISLNSFIVKMQFMTYEFAAPEKNNSIADWILAEGNAALEKRDYFAAMRLFNSSLGIAEHYSNEAATALANRSKCFFYLNMPEECLADIEMVKMGFGADENIIKGLDSYATKSKNLMEDEQFKRSLFIIRKPTLSFKEHEIFPGVADCLKIQKNRAFGRHVITKCDLEIGQTILVEEPFAVAIGFVKGYNRCWCCFGENKNFITCKHCVGHLYCDKDCMEKSFHKYECNQSEMATLDKFALVRKMLYKLNDAFPDVDNLMNVVDKMLNGKDTITTNAEQRAFCLLFQLVHNHEKLSDEKSREFRIDAAKIYLTIIKFQDYQRKFKTMKHRRFLQHLILHLFHIGEHAVNLLGYDNTFKNDDDSGLCHKLQYYAKGMYPFACQMNHSCLPNVIWVPFGNRLVCRVIQPIQKGQQIFCSYL